MDEKNTRAWELYEQGVLYNERLIPSQYTLVDTNTDFFIGNQWVNLPKTRAMCGLPKPVFNILKRVSSLFIASLTSSGTSLHFEPLAYYDGSNLADPQHDAAEFANAEIGNLLEKLKLDYRIRDALFDGAVSGDFCAHFWFDPDKRPFGGAFDQTGGVRGEVQMELVDGINVMFGNPNDCRVQTQPYVLLVGRDTVANLRAESEYHRKADNPEQIIGDSDYDKMPGFGGKTELFETDNADGKALYVILYEKVRGDDGDRVHVTKATKTAVIYEDVDTGLSLYPIAWGNWEKQKNQYHGRALVTGLIPNQIFINSMFATAMRHMQLAAFPKAVFNADLISRWDSEPGTAIGVHGMQPGQSIGQIATSISPAEMSGQIFALIDKVMAYTKECLGATDAQMGNVKPDNTSALMVLQTNAEVPLENIRANLYEWVEDIGAILLDMMGTYYGERPVVLDREMDEIMMDAAGMPMISQETGMIVTQTVTRRVVESFDFSQFRSLWFNLRVDVGATTYFSEIAMTQTLDNLRRDGTLDVIQYLDRLPDKLIPQKKELLDELKKRVAEGQQANAAAGAAPSAGGGYAQGGELDAEKLQAILPVRMQAQYQGLPGVARRSALVQGAFRAR